MFKSYNGLIKIILFTLPLIMCLYLEKSYANSYAEFKREIDIKVLRQEKGEILSEVKVNKQSQFLLIKNAKGITITAPKYTLQTIDDMVILREALGIYGASLLPADHPAAIPRELRNYAQNKFIQSVDYLEKMAHCPELYLLSGIKFRNREGETGQFFVQTSVLAGGASLFTPHYSPNNIELMGKLMSAIGWTQVGLFPVNHAPRVPAHLSSELIKIFEVHQIEIDNNQALRTIWVSPDFLSAEKI